MKKILPVLALIFSATCIKAQETKKIDDHYIDFAVPDLSAFKLLEIDGDKISRPGNVKKLSAELLNIVSAGNRISPGLAIEISPYRIFSTGYDSIDRKTYRKKQWIRNLQISYGTVSDTAGTKMALGLKWTIIDKSDPLLDDQYSKAITALREDETTEILVNISKFNNEYDAFKKQLDASRGFNNYISNDSTSAALMEVENEKINVDTKYLADQIISQINSLIQAKGRTDLLTTKEEEQIQMFVFRLRILLERKIANDKDLSNLFSKLKEEYKKNHWNSSMLQFTLGAPAISQDNKWSSLQATNITAYINGSLKLKRWGQLIGLLSYSLTPDNYVKNDSASVGKFFGGCRLIAGNSDQRISIDLGGTRIQTKDETFSTTVVRGTLGVEFKMSDGLWLEIAGGINSDINDLKEKNILALGSLKYALQPKQRFSR